MDHSPIRHRNVERKMVEAVLPHAERDLLASIRAPGWAATPQARQLLEAASVGWRLHVVMGEAASQIVGLAETPGVAGINGINGIVIGSRGQSAAKALMLGSGVSDPEAKRKIIGGEFVAVFKQEAARLTVSPRLSDHLNVVDHLRHECGDRRRHRPRAARGAGRQRGDPFRVTRKNGARASPGMCSEVGEWCLF